MTQALRDLLSQFVSRGRLDAHALYHPPKTGEKRGRYHPLHRGLGEDEIKSHLMNDVQLGIYVFDKDLGIQGLTRLAVIDLDDKEKTRTWGDMFQQGKRVAEKLAARGLVPWMCRSGGGAGLHIWYIWDEPQPAKVVRDVLRAAVKAAGVTVHVDLFPSSEALLPGKGSVPELGTLVALPLSRASRPVSDVTGEISEKLETWLPVLPTPSRSLVTAGPVDLGTLARDAGRGHAPADERGFGRVDEETLKAALRHIATDDYNIWKNVGLALKHAVSEGQLEEDIAERAWREWASADPKFDERTQDYNWRRMRPSGKMSLGTVWHLAKEGGWKEIRETRSERQLKRQETVQAQISGMSNRHDAETVRRLPWLAGGAPEHVDELNKDHFIALEGGKATIFKEEYDEVFKREMLRRMMPHDFKIIHQNQKVVVGTKKRGGEIIENLGDAWLDDPHRRQYDSIVLRPEGCPVNHYNLWRGFTVKPSEAGSCELWKSHVRENLCSGNEVIFEYLMSWCARTFQRPQEPIGTAIVLRGGKGTGKGTFGRALGELFGQHYLQIFSSKDLTGRFNFHLRDAIFLFADEALWAGNKAEASVLSGIITEPTLPIEGKGKDLVQVRNMLHLVISTNNEWSVPAGLDERRFLALHVSDDKKQNVKYFQPIWDQLRDGGMARLLWELLNRDLSKFNAFNVPRTEELFTQKVQSMDPWTEWWFERLQSGEPMSQVRWDWNSEVPVMGLFFDYVAFCRVAGHRLPKGVRHTTHRLAEILPRYEKPTRQRLESELNFMVDVLRQGSLQSFIKLPPLADCRAFFEKKTQQDIEWEKVVQRAVDRGQPVTEDERLMV